MLSRDQKSKIIKEYATTAGDTGSPDVQVALLTSKVNQLTEHLKMHQKDNHSRKGLLKMVAKRRRFLNYILANDPKKYKELTSKLALSS